MTAPLRVATRGSALARWQAERVIARLARPTELVIVSTQGDRDRTSAIHAIGGTGVFVKEVQDTVLRGEADIAVHSAKDLPAVTAAGLIIAAVPERADVRDALVGARLADLPPGATIGTGSVRRRTQLAHHRPDLEFGELRGNVPTRVERASNFDAVVIALAALERLELTERVAEVLDTTLMLPMVAQGALAIECRADDEATRAHLTEIDDVDAHRGVRAERAFLRELGGGCTMACAALATIDSAGALHLDALLATVDGATIVRTTATGDDPESLGTTVARRILDDLGGTAILRSDTTDPAGDGVME